MAKRLRTRRWAGLVFISIAVSLIIVDSTIVNVAVPSIVDDLGISSTEVQWVQEAYTLVFASFLLVFGSLADRFGRRRLLVLGVIVFAAASIAASLAPTGGTLIASRLLQGVGGSIILPTTLSLINATFRGRERGIAFAVWGSTIGGMAAVGPLLGGWLTTAFSWRWAFGINIPLSAIIVVGVLLTVAESRTDHRTSIDASGAVLSVLTMAPLVFALIEGRTYGWWEADTVPTVGAWTWPFSLSPVPIAFAVALVALTGFVAWGVRRQRRGRSTLLALDLFRIGSFRNGNIAAAVVSLGEFGIILALPLWLQFVVGFDALQTGLLLLSLAIGSFVASAIAGALSGKVSPVAVVRGGLLAEVVGVGGVALTIGSDAAWVPLIPFLFVYGLGVGLATAQLTGVVLADVPASASGQASGTQSTSRQLGAALGVAILGTVLFSTTGTVLAGSLADRGISAAQSDQIVAQVVDSAGAAIPALAQSPQTEDVAADARAAFSDGTRAAALTAGAFLILGLASTLTLGREGGRTRRGAAGPSGAVPSESGEDAAPKPFT